MSINTYVPTTPDIPQCPLCLNRFVMVIDPSKSGPMYVCTRPGCMISIPSSDPMLDRYDKIAAEDVGCPKCGEKMRFFCRSDGYMKSVCPKCHASLEVGKENYDV